MLSESTKQYINASGGGTITNFADDEDIQSKNIQSGNVLKFADRAFSPDRFSGNGYKILRRNIVNGKNILTQEWNKKDLTIGISSIVLGSIAKYFITLI